MSLMMMMEEGRIRLTGAKIFKIGISLIPPVFLIFHFRCNIFLSLDLHQCHERQNPPPNRNQQSLRLQAHFQSQSILNSISNKSSAFKFIFFF